MTTPVYCETEPLDELKRGSLYITAARLRTHNHTVLDHPCQQCLGDMLTLGAHGFLLMNLLHDADEQIDVLRALVADFVDTDDCLLDHHGYCQAHSLHKNCPHARAKELLGIGGESR